MSPTSVQNSDRAFPLVVVVFSCGGTRVSHRLVHLPGLMIGGGKKENKICALVVHCLVLSFFGIS